MNYIVDYRFNRNIHRLRHYYNSILFLFERKQKKKTHKSSTPITLFADRKQVLFVSNCHNVSLQCSRLPAYMSPTASNETPIYITDYQVCRLIDVFAVRVDVYDAAKRYAKQQNIAHRIITYRNLIFIATSTQHTEIKQINLD